MFTYSTHVNSPLDFGDDAQDLVECLLKAPPDRLLSYLSTLGQIVKYAPKFYERHETALAAFLLNKQILSSTKGDQEVSWVDTISPLLF
jgi:hypothetical protein